MLFSLLNLLSLSLCLTLFSHSFYIPNLFLLINLAVITIFTLAQIYQVKIFSSSSVSKLIKLFFVLIVISIIFIHYGFHFTQDIAIVLFLTMLCFKLFEIQDQYDRRNIIFILYLQYFALAVSFINSQDFIQLLFVLMTVMLLLFIQILFSQGKTNLLLLKKNMGLTFAIQTRLILLAIPLCCILFVFFPRIPGPLWTLPSLTQQGVTGLSDKMYPGSVNQLADSDEIVFSITFDEKIPQAAQLYWRGPVLSKTDGFIWEQNKDYDEALAEKNSFASPLVERFGQSLSYEVTLEPQQQKWLFTLEMPSFISSQSVNGQYLSKSVQVLLRQNLRQVVQYKAQSNLNFKLNKFDQTEIEQSLIYPLSNQRTYALGQKWKNELKDNKAAIVEKALDYYVKQQFYYTRSPEQMLKNPVDQFLFDKRRGFCEHFASSFVLLMRAAGIPARVVTGYQGMSYNKMGKYYVVRQANAHAWAEVWLGEKKGWKRVDPTAVIPQSHVEEDVFNSKRDNLQFFNFNYANVKQLQQDLMQNSSLQQSVAKLKQSFELLKYNWNKWMLAYDDKKQQLLLSLLGLGNGVKTLVFLLITLCSFILFVFFLWQFKQQIKQQDPLVSLYEKFLTQLEKNGVIVSNNDGPEKIQNYCCEKFPGQEKQLRRIFSLFIQLRYGKKQQPILLQKLKRQIKSLNLTA